MKKGQPDPSTGGADRGVAGGDPDALQRLLESARGDGLGAGQLEALWSRVGPAAVPGAGDPTSASGAGGAGTGSAATAGGLGVKAIAALLVGGALATGGAVQVWRSRQPPVPPVIVVAATGQGSDPAPSPLDPVAPPDPSPPPVGVSALPLASTPVRASASPKGSRGAAASGAEGHAFDRSLARQFPDHDPSSGSGASAANVAPAVRAAADPSPQGASDVQSTRTTSALAPAASEGSLLLRARQRLSSDPAAALALTDEHARRFPDGTLAPEREVLAIEALAALGRLPDARARLAAFRARFPQSPHLARLDALVAAGR